MSGASHRLHEEPLLWIEVIVFLGGVPRVRGVCQLLADFYQVTNPICEAYVGHMQPDKKQQIMSGEVIVENFSD